MADTAKHRLGPRLLERNSKARRVTLSARNTPEIRCPRCFGGPSLPLVVVAGHLGKTLRFSDRNTFLRRTMFCPRSPAPQPFDPFSVK